jgi:hypothetical protein
MTFLSKFKVRLSNRLHPNPPMDGAEPELHQAARSINLSFVERWLAPKPGKSSPPMDCRRSQQAQSSAFPNHGAGRCSRRGRRGASAALLCQFRDRGRYPCRLGEVQGHSNQSLSTLSDASAPQSMCVGVSGLPEGLLSRRIARRAPRLYGKMTQHGRPAMPLTRPLGNHNMARHRAGLPPAAGPTG